MYVINVYKGNMNKNVVEWTKIFVVWTAYIYLLKYALWIDKISSLIKDKDIQILLLIIISGFIIFQFLLFLKKFFWDFKNFFFSNLVIFCFFLLLLPIMWYPFHFNYLLFVKVKDLLPWKLIILIPLLTVFSIAILWGRYIWQLIFTKIQKYFYGLEKNESWLLFADSPLDWKNKEEDKLWFYKKADIFSKLVNNNWSSNTFVFWLIAPWGGGKSSFLNIFKNNPINNNHIIYDFNPWYFESEKDLLKNFLDWLAQTIKDNYTDYLPDLENDFDELVKILQEKTSTIIGISLPFTAEKSLIDIKKKINNSLKKIEKKVIVVIDDLDRVSLEKLKGIFKMIDLCRSFPNTNFIVCYDPENFNSIETPLKITHSKKIEDEGKKIFTQKSNEKIDNSELLSFIEKIINVHFSLEIGISEIKSYFEYVFFERKESIFYELNNWFFDIKKNISSLYDSIWRDYLMNPRWIKRVYNLFVYLWYNEKHISFSQLFDNSFWIKFDTFLKLYLLKIYHKDLYDCIIDNFKNKKEYWLDNWWNIFAIWHAFWTSKDSRKSDYEGYLNTLSYEKSLLVKDIFWWPKDTNNEIKDIIQNFYRYLDLLETYEKTSFNIFMQEWISWKYWTLKEFIENTLFAFDTTTSKEKIVNEFVLFFTENIRNFNESEKRKKALEFINYALDSFFVYSINWVLSRFRYDIIKILDYIAPYDNTKPENLKYIYDFVYWEWEEWKGKGVLDKLFENKWWIPWLYVCLWFFADRYDRRSLNFFNYETWITQLTNENWNAKWWDKYYFSAKMARKIYSLFKQHFIIKGKNLFKEIENLDEKYLKTLQNTSRERDRKSVRAFITYYLTYWIWYFNWIDDETRWDEYKNQHEWIKKELNAYYFNVCFKDNLEIFLDYLVCHIGWEINSNYFLDRIDKISEIVGIFKLERVYEIFDKRLLKNFLIDNRSELTRLLNEKWDIIGYEFQNDKWILKLKEISPILERLKDYKEDSETSSEWQVL